jgi:hypothetical protein
VRMTPSLKATMPRLNPKLCDIHSTSANIHTNEAHKNNNKTPIFIGLNKTTQKHGHRKRKITRERIKNYISNYVCFRVNDKNAISLKYFDLRTSAGWRFRKVNNCLRMAKYGRNM